MQKVGLTGSAGMTGRHMHKLLEQEGIACVRVSRAEWDLRDWMSGDALDDLFDGVEAVFHFGATLPRKGGEGSQGRSWTQEVFDANVRSCLNLAEWAASRGVPVVFLSGSTVYEEPYACGISEEAPKTTHGFGGFYGYSKLLAEHVLNYFEAEGLMLAILRPTSIYGYGLGKGNFVANCLDVASAGGTIRLDAPENRVNFVHAWDVSCAALAALRRQAWGVYNIAGAACPSILELAEAAVGVCGGGSIQLVESTSTANPPFVRFDLDCSKAHRDLGFEPVVDLSKGLELMRLGRLRP